MLSELKSWYNGPAGIVALSIVVILVECTFEVSVIGRMFDISGIWICWLWSRTDTILTALEEAQNQIHELQAVQRG
jgi:hypothetical protein